jgi:hypothetical protein
VKGQAQQLLAHPWWVNLLFLVPCAAYFSFRKSGLQLPWRLLAGLTIWSAAFGLVEAVVVVYLNALIGIPLGYHPTLADIGRLSVDLEEQRLHLLPQDVLAVEMWREGATIVMLVSVAILTAPAVRERVACFLWAFAVWDLTYYATLRLTTGWPSSLTTPDVLFLLPEPWLGQVWFPLLVSSATLLAIALSRRRHEQPRLPLSPH